MDKQVEVAFATANTQIIIPVSIEENATVRQAIETSGILEEFKEIDLSKMKVGIFGQVSSSLNKVVEQGDRIEIYRPLQRNPMDARRHRALETNK